MAWSASYSKGLNATSIPYVFEILKDGEHFGHISSTEAAALFGIEDKNGRTLDGIAQDKWELLSKHMSDYGLTKGDIKLAGLRGATLSSIKSGKNAYSDYTTSINISHISSVAKCVEESTGAENFGPGQESKGNIVELAQCGSGPAGYCMVDALCEITGEMETTLKFPSGFLPATPVVSTIKAKRKAVCRASKVGSANYYCTGSIDSCYHSSEVMKDEDGYTLQYFPDGSFQSASSAENISWVPEQGLLPYLIKTKSCSFAYGSCSITSAAGLEQIGNAVCMSNEIATAQNCAYSSAASLLGSMPTSPSSNLKSQDTGVLTNEQ